ncbi:hypothetical protein CLV92_1307 [Kineococcus xinjiangensis]|uniref:Uncharacterized protein n=1 Tax=Kineococcus xinjiangensis TaxID=512762 RepID=A0A2S6IBT3_9ACTN|nr:hypothetical protein [Kineococcus xinjiangensis]PPK89818.1 hypothetical protein CLV92_1307 [Kineococcus xinjiangensis]
MDTPTTNTPTASVRPWWQRKPAVVAAIAALGVSGMGIAATAAAGGFAVSVNENGVVMNDLSRVANVYNGRIVTLGEIQDLNDEGQALYSSASPELTCQGIMLHFDTPAEADEYGHGYTARAKAHAAKTTAGGTIHPGAGQAAAPAGTAPEGSIAATEDPCAAFKDSPSFVPEGVKLPAASSGQR